MIALVTVHTTGVNWDGILANVASITVILFAFAAVIVRSIKRSIKDEIEEVVARDISPKLDVIQAELKVHDTRIARLEGVEEGKRQAVAAAGVTVTDSKPARSRTR